MALELKSEQLSVTHKFTYVNFDKIRFQFEALAWARFTVALNKPAVTFTSVAFSLLVKQWVFFYAKSLAWVALTTESAWLFFWAFANWADCVYQYLYLFTNGFCL